MHKLAEGLRMFSESGLWMKDKFQVEVGSVEDIFMVSRWMGLCMQVPYLFYFIVKSCK